MQEEIKRECEFCGKEFATIDLRKKYCNAECRDKAAQLRDRQKRQSAGAEKKAICACCGKEFSKGRKKLYCSAECYNEAAKQRGKARYAETRTESKVICALCGKEFRRGKDRKAYCSIECASEARNVKEVYSMKRDRKKSQLAITNEAARNAHMTYGQYKAMQYMKTMEGIKI